MRWTMSSYRYSSEANSDMEQILSHIFERNPAAANRFLDTLEETCELLAEHPEVGSSRPALANGLRSFPIGNHLNFYNKALEGKRSPILSMEGEICRAFSNDAFLFLISN